MYAFPFVAVVMKGDLTVQFLLINGRLLMSWGGSRHVLIHPQMEYVSTLLNSPTFTAWGKREGMKMNQAVTVYPEKGSDLKRILPPPPPPTVFSQLQYIFSLQIFLL